MKRERSIKYKPEQHSERSRSASRSRSRQRQEKVKVKNKGRPTKKPKLQINESQALEEELSKSMRQIQSMADIQQEMLECTIIEHWITFFHAVQEEKGLVISDKDRKLLISRAKYEQKLAQYEWSLRHQWHENLQKEKIIRMGRLFQIDMENQKNSKLFETLLGVSPIFAQEFTEEIYRFHLNIYRVMIGRGLLCQQTSQDKAASLKKEEKEDKAIHNEKLLGRGQREMENKESVNDKKGQSQKKQQLKELANIVCLNNNGKYYLLSFQFKKPKAGKPKEPPLLPEDKLTIYETLTINIYQVLQRLQSIE